MDAATKKEFISLIKSPEVQEALHGTNGKKSKSEPTTEPTTEPTADAMIAEGLRKLTMVEMANLPSKRGDWKGYTVTALTYTGAATTGAVVEHLIEKNVLGNATSAIERLLVKIFG